MWFEEVKCTCQLQSTEAENQAVQPRLMLLMLLAWIVAQFDSPFNTEISGVRKRWWIFLITYTDDKVSVGSIKYTCYQQGYNIIISYILKLLYCIIGFLSKWHIIYNDCFYLNAFLYGYGKIYLFFKVIVTILLIYCLQKYKVVVFFFFWY